MDEWEEEFHFNGSPVINRQGLKKLQDYYNSPEAETDGFYRVKFTVDRSRLVDIVANNYNAYDPHDFAYRLAKVIESGHVELFFKGFAYKTTLRVTKNEVERL